MENKNEILLYTCTDSPPGRAVQIVLKHLQIPYTFKDVNFGTGEHFSPEFLEMYPQGEIPVLSDNGFVVGESVAIIQYLSEKYPKDDTFYPKKPEARAILHHRLAFHLSTYQKRLYDYMILPFDYDYEKTEANLVKLKHAVKVLDEFLRRQNTSFVAGENLTIADPPLLMATAFLYAMKFDFTPYPNVLKWYHHFQSAFPELWAVAQEGLDGLKYYTENPRDMSSLKHPLHPTKKN